MIFTDMRLVKHFKISPEIKHKSWNYSKIPINKEKLWPSLVHTNRKLSPTSSEFHVLNINKKFCRSTGVPAIDCFNFLNETNVRVARTIYTSTNICNILFCYARSPFHASKRITNKKLFNPENIKMNFFTMSGKTTGINSSPFVKLISRGLLAVRWTARMKNCYGWMKWKVESPGERLSCETDPTVDW